MNEETLKGRIAYKTNHPSEEHPADRSFNKLMKRIRADQPVMRSKRYHWYAVAACTVLLIGIGYWYLSSVHGPETYQFSAGSSRQQYTLPDGTLVWLNSSSTLTYTGKFGKKIREVELAGEAYFEVARDTLTPFIVKTRYQNVKVLGTIFNIRSHPGDTITTTTLVKGSVAIRSRSDQDIMLAPGQQLTIDTRNNRIALSQVDCALYTDWKEGKIIFKDTPVVEAFGCLSRNYQVDIILKKQFIDRKITGLFYTDNRLEDVLAIMQEIIPFNYQIHNRQVIIR